MNKTINISQALELRDAVFVDTRTPKEFLEDHIPGAINIPIFNNEERAIVGTLYKNNRVKAYQEGFEIYNKKILSFIKSFEQIDKKKRIIVYCWRGGMRSKTIVELLTSLGKDTYQLVDGYKAYRKYVRESLENYKPSFKLIVIQGMAGSGKTDLIRRLKPSIDLEGLAKHRSSVFGAIGLKPVSQKMFETNFLKRIKELEDEKVIFVEGEAKKVGNINLPKKFFEHLQRSTTILIKTSLENRSKRIVRDYFSHNEDEQIKKIITGFKDYLSKKVVDELTHFVDEKEYEAVAKVLLRDYYDKQYSFAFKNQEFASEVNAESTESATRELIKLKKACLIE